MFVMTRTIKIQKGNSDKLVARFSGESPMDSMDGLVDVSVLVNDKNKEYDEVLVLIRWESQEAWKNWEKSDAHIQGHKENRGKQPPEFIISTEVKLFDGDVVKRGKASR